MQARRCSELDLLRFLAALAVVGFHYLHLARNSTGLHIPAARYGYMGVDLFFLISGFVIMLSASQGKVRSFVASRAARLLPAFWTCCTVTFLALAAFGEFRGWGNYLANMTMAGLLAPIRFMDGSSWSLAYEIRFYALVALVLAAGWIGHAERLLVAWLAAAFVLTAYPVRFVSGIVMSDYAAHFIAGSTMYFVWARGMTWQRATVLLACLALAEFHSIRLAGILTARDGIEFDPAVVALAVVAGFGVMLAVALRMTGPLARGSWLTVGAITYPLYLLHQAIGVMAIQRGAPWWLVAGGMIFAAWLVTTQVEARWAKPMREWLEGKRGWWLERKPAEAGQR